jgi:hypothetical protein
VADDAIYIVDQITSRPGQGETFFKFYMDGYAPSARARGLELKHSFVNPPVWLNDDQSNVFIFVWAISGGVGGIWQVMATPEALDGSLSFWWRDAEPMIATRSRAIFSEAASIASLTNV